MFVFLKSTQEQYDLYAVEEYKKEQTLSVVLQGMENTHKNYSHFQKLCAPLYIFSRLGKSCLKQLGMKKTKSSHNQKGLQNPPPPKKNYFIFPWTVYLWT